MLGYLSADIICSEKQTVSFEEQIMSKDKYPRIFSKPNWGYCVYYSSVLKIGEYPRIFPSFSWGIFAHVTRLDHSRASENIWGIIQRGECNTSWHGGQLVNEFSTYLKDITLSPGYLKDGEYFKWLLLSLDLKSFQQLVFKAVNNRKRSGYVDCQRGQIDWLFFSKLKLLILRQWWQLWMKSVIKQR